MHPMTPHTTPENARTSVALSGPAVRARRKRKRVSVTEVAAAVGITRQWLSYVERGESVNVSAGVADRLAEQLGCRLSAIRAK